MTRGPLVSHGLLDSDARTIADQFREQVKHNSSTPVGERILCNQMLTVRIEHDVPNYQMWKAVFHSDPADRKGSAVRRYQVFRAQDDPNYVLVDLDFETLGEAETFIRAMELMWEGPGKSVMRNPRSRIADRIEVVEVSKL